MAAMRGKILGDGSELFGDWDVPLNRSAKMAFILMDRSDWQVLPANGGWFDQDEGLMDNISTLARMSMYVRAQLEVNEAESSNDDHH